MSDLAATNCGCEDRGGWDVAALITADADATMAADVITDVDVTVDGDFQAEIIPAVISSGSSSFCACAETITADAAMAAADVATVTTAGLLSCCFCYVETMAVDVAADNHFLLAGGSFPLPLYILQDYNFVLIIHAA